MSHERRWQGRVTIKQIALVGMLLCGVCLGQSGSVRPTTNIPDAEFPRINRDLSATFRIQADQAHKVQVLMEFGQSTFDMVKSEDGYWSVTTTPLLPGFHYYAISVDGFPANDPEAKSFSPRGEKSAGWKFQEQSPISLPSRMCRTAHCVESGMSRKRQARRDGFLFIRRRDTIRVGYATRSFIFNTGMEKTKPVGRTRAMRTSFWTI